MTQIKEKKHRLPSDFYVGFATVAVTACIEGMFPVFVNSNVVIQFSDTLIYLFMPDHLHVILKGKAENAQPLKAMNKFKQKTGYWFSQNAKQVQWQKSYYDHLIRNDEGVMTHVRYILDNPVRKGIVADWSDYPFKGSTVFNFNKELIDN